MRTRWASIRRNRQRSFRAVEGLYLGMRTRRLSVRKNRPTSIGGAIGTRSSFVRVQRVPVTGTPLAPELARALIPKLRVTRQRLAHRARGHARNRSVCKRAIAPVVRGRWRSLARAREPRTCARGKIAARVIGHKRVIAFALAVRGRRKLETERTISRSDLHSHRDQHVAICPRTTATS